MQTKSISFGIFLVFLSIAALLYWAGTSSVPFHPDESTYLFTSGDIELFWHDPTAVFWTPEKNGDLRQFYRMIVAPMINHLIALSRWIVGEAPLAVDWDWGLTWAENARLGALPSARLLLTGRMASAALYPFSILLIYLATRKFSNEFTAWVAALLLASNALVLLHTRRAMSEGPLLFAVALCLWSLGRFERRAFWNAIPNALAYCAKHSLAALAPAALLALVWPARATAHSRRILAFQIALYGVLVLLTLAAFNPYLWARPVQAYAATLQARRDLLAGQAGDRPSQQLNSVSYKLASMVYNLYFAPLMFAETGNYVEETRAAEQTYQANPFHSLLRSQTAGIILMVLNLFGFCLAALSAARDQSAPRRDLLLLLTANVSMAAALWLLDPLPWQRHYLPLVPFICIWVAYALNRLGMTLVSAWKSAKAARSA